MPLPLPVQAEEERAAAQAKRDFFTGTLAELRLAQSKVTRAVVEAQQRCGGPDGVKKRMSRSSCRSGLGLGPDGAE